MGTALLVLKGRLARMAGPLRRKAITTIVRGPVRFRSVTKIMDNDTHTFEMYATYKGAKEEKMMEITYTRKH